jgi:hypothetical protein
MVGNDVVVVFCKLSNLVKPKNKEKRKVVKCPKFGHVRSIKLIFDNLEIIIL